MKLFDAFRDHLAKPLGTPPAFDAQSVTQTIQRSLASAGLATDSGPMKDVIDTIERALGDGGLHDRERRQPEKQGRTIEGTAYEVKGDRPHRTRPRTAQSRTTGQFLGRSFTSEAGTLVYRLYIPASYADGACEPMPLIVMLHGCTQSPEDFAAGTRMNLLAEQHGFLVAYPGQSRNANGSNCWNWFKAENHARDGGEPSLIAGVTRCIADEYRVDKGRIFIAGLSAGAAMAVILGETYPELFAAVGAHSGLPYAAAHDVPSAYAAMNGGSAATGMSHAGGKRRMGRPPASMPVNSVPTIVFHGGADATVNARNGAEIAEQAVRAAHASRAHPAPLGCVVERDIMHGGRACERTVLSDATGRPLVEQWRLHGAGHAWSGGSPTGSFTDRDGPDASAEMARFFFAQQPQASPPYRLT
jgi:poly(hydroxyalkanoate) depolymerase family esterase